MSVDSSLARRLVLAFAAAISRLLDVNFVDVPFNDFYFVKTGWTERTKKVLHASLVVPTADVPCQVGLLGGAIITATDITRESTSCFTSSSIITMYGFQMSPEIALAE